MTKVSLDSLVAVIETKKSSSKRIEISFQVLVTVSSIRETKKSSSKRIEIRITKDDVSQRRSRNKEILK